jgi:hypothetical protein
MEKPISIFGVNINFHMCISIFGMIYQIIFYRTGWNGTERPIDIFEIKTIFAVVSQSLA